MSRTDSNLVKKNNPVIRADYPDPDVIRVGDVYYMLSSTFHFLPGAVILRSYDLLNWEIASYVFDGRGADDQRAQQLWLRYVGRLIKVLQRTVLRELCGEGDM